MKLQFHLMNWYGQTISKKVCDRAVFLEKIWYLILWSRFLITTKDMYIHHKTCYRDESQKKMTIKLSVENIDTPPIRNRPERHDNLPTKSTFNMDTTRNRSCVDWRYSIVMGTWSGWQQRWHNCWSLLSWWCVMESASGLHHACQTNKDGVSAGRGKTCIRNKMCRWKRVKWRDGQITENKKEAKIDTKFLLCRIPFPGNGRRLNSCVSPIFLYSSGSLH